MSIGEFGLHSNDHFESRLLVNGLYQKVSFVLFHVWNRIGTALGRFLFLRFVTTQQQRKWEGERRQVVCSNRTWHCFTRKQDMTFFYSKTASHSRVRSSSLPVRNHYWNLRMHSDVPSVCVHVVASMTGYIHAIMSCAASQSDVAGTPLLLWQAIELQELLDKGLAILSARGVDAGGSALWGVCVCCFVLGDGGSSADTRPWMWYWNDQASYVTDRSGRCRLACKQPRHISRVLTRDTVCKKTSGEDARDLRPTCFVR